MSKYIIKNCPAFMKPSYCKDKCSYSITNKRDGELTYKFEFDENSKCQDCTDCVMKQIVELCRHYKKHSDCGRDCPSFGMFLSKLLSKLDIQEVE